MEEGFRKRIASHRTTHYWLKNGTRRGTRALSPISCPWVLHTPIGGNASVERTTSSRHRRIVERTRCFVVVGSALKCRLPFLCGSPCLRDEQSAEQLPGNRWRMGCGKERLVVSQRHDRDIAQTRLVEVRSWTLVERFHSPSYGESSRLSCVWSAFLRFGVVALPLHCSALGLCSEPHIVTGQLVHRVSEECVLDMLFVLQVLFPCDLAHDFPICYVSGLAEAMIRRWRLSLSCVCQEAVKHVIYQTDVLFQLFS